jgi:hypothetical protein
MQISFALNQYVKCLDIFRYDGISIKHSLTDRANKYLADVSRGSALWQVMGTNKIIKVSYDM